MHTGTELPKSCFSDTPMNKVLYEISSKRLGLATIVDEMMSCWAFSPMVTYV